MDPRVRPRADNLPQKPLRGQRVTRVVDVPLNRKSIPCVFLADVTNKSDSDSSESSSKESCLSGQVSAACLRLTLFPVKVSHTRSLPSCDALTICLSGTQKCKKRLRLGHLLAFAHQCGLFLGGGASASLTWSRLPSAWRRFWPGDL